MTYDHIGRRTSLTTGGETTFFHYAGGLLVAESDEDGDISATYAYAPEGGLISMTRGENTYYYQTNAHGDVVSLTDDTGAVVNTYSYDPWGEVLSASETVTNPFRYATYYYDYCTGLYYLWHRYYDPGLRRFLTLDPAYLSTGERYSYCGGNPLANWDSAGLSWYHVFVPWSEENPIWIDAYNGGDGASVTTAMNPVYWAIAGYYNEVQASRKGCPYSGCLAYGLQGALGVAATLDLATGGRLTGALMTGLSESIQLGRLAEEAGYITVGRARFTQDVQHLFSLLEKNHGIDPKLASLRLHQMKAALGYGPADEMLFDLTGNVYDPVTGDWLGSLTAGGSKTIR
jgi:RHS repeat-associated protein